MWEECREELKWEIIIKVGVGWVGCDDHLSMEMVVWHTKLESIYPAHLPLIPFQFEILEPRRDEKGWVSPNLTFPLMIWETDQVYRTFRIAQFDQTAPYVARPYQLNPYRIIFIKYYKFTNY